MKLGNNLRRIRFESGELSQESLAGAVEVTRQTIISIEKGRFVPSTLLALRLADALNKQVEEIFFLTDEDKTPVKRS